MGFSLPALNAYDFKLYPLYRGGSVVNASNAGAQGLGVNSTFTTANTQFSQGFSVNDGGNTNVLSDSHFFSVNQNGQLTRNAISSASRFSNNLSFDPTKPGAISTGATHTVATAPTSPTTYQDYLRFLSISDFNFNDLMTANNTFKMPNVGTGIEYKTDALGNIDSHRLDLNIRAIAGESGALDPSFAFTNRAETLQKLAQNSPLGNLAEDIALRTIDTNASQGGSVFPTIDLNSNDNSSLGLNLKANKNKGVTGSQGVQNPFGAQGNDLSGGLRNPLLERLFAQRQPNPGLAVAGENSAFKAGEAQQLATVQAGLNVSLSDSHRQTMQALVSSAVENGNAYVKPQAVMHAVDGMMPMTPALPATGGLGVNDRAHQGLMDVGLPANGGVEDALSKKGSGGQIPFSMSSGGGDTGAFMGGAGTGSGSGELANPFGGGQQPSSDQQQQQQRKPLFLSA